VMLASSNELHLDAFKGHPDWPSFKGRMELVTAPYLLRVQDELTIYESQVPRSLTGQHIAPHALEVAATFAVLTRLEAPDPGHYPPQVRDVIASLTPVEKLRIYDTGEVPERLSQKEKKELRAVIHRLYEEHTTGDQYEGRYGASAREIRAVILNASQDRRFDHLSPIAVIDELRQLARARSSYEWLRREGERGYHDVDALLNELEAIFTRTLEEEVRGAMGLVRAGSHIELFERYLKNVSAWTKGEKLADPATGKLNPADEDLMNSVEQVLMSAHETAEDFRRGLIAQIGAYKLEHPDDDVDYALLFGGWMRKLNEDFHVKHKKGAERIETAFVRLLDDDFAGVDAKDLEQARRMRGTLHGRGYTDASARTVIAWLLRHRR
jgi:serine protein kinase